MVTSSRAVQLVELVVQNWQAGTLTVEGVLQPLLQSGG
jgi:hypothetical protein